MRTSRLEETFALQVRALGLPEPVREYRFHHERRFRVDFAWPDLKIAVEVDGGTWNNGRHTRGQGFHNDCIKKNLLSCSGWSVLTGDSKMVASGELVRSLEELINKKMEDAR